MDFIDTSGGLANVLNVLVSTFKNKNYKLKRKQKKKTNEMINVRIHERIEYWVRNGKHTHFAYDN